MGDDIADLVGFLAFCTILGLLGWIIYLLLN